MPQSDFFDFLDKYNSKAKKSGKMLAPDDFLQFSLEYRYPRSSKPKNKRAEAPVNEQHHTPISKRVKLYEEDEKQYSNSLPTFFGSSKQHKPSPYDATSHNPSTAFGK